MSQKIEHSIFEHVVTSTRAWSVTEDVLHRRGEVESMTGPSNFRVFESFLSPLLVRWVSGLDCRLEYRGIFGEVPRDPGNRDTPYFHN